jgi:hypothetical protein
MLRFTILNYTITILYYFTILHYTITILYYTILYYTILSYTMLCYALLYCTILLLYYTIIYYYCYYYYILTDGQFARLVFPFHPEHCITTCSECTVLHYYSTEAKLDGLADTNTHTLCMLVCATGNTRTYITSQLLRPSQLPAFDHHTYWSRPRDSC